MRPEQPLPGFFVAVSVTCARHLIAAQPSAKPSARSVWSDSATLSAFAPPAVAQISHQNQRIDVIPLQRLSRWWSELSVTRLMGTIMKKILKTGVALAAL